MDPNPFLNLFTSYVLAATKFDPPTWESYSDGLVPHLAHNRPYYLVEVVPRPGASPLMSVASPIFSCAYKAMDDWFLRPIESVVSGRPAPPRGKYGPASLPGHYFYDVHVWKFVLDPLSKIVSNPDKPMNWGIPTSWFDPDEDPAIKPCYFSELDPFRWRYGVTTDGRAGDRGRYWEGWKSPDVDGSEQGRAMKFHSLGPLNDPSGHVANTNPVSAAIVAALRGIQNGVHPESGWGAFCAGEEDLFKIWNQHGRTHDPIDTEGSWPGSTFNIDRHEKRIDLHIQLVHPLPNLGDSMRPIPIGWTNQFAASDHPGKGDYERAPYWYSPSCFDPPCKSPPADPQSSDGYVFLVWLRHEHSLGEEVGELAWGVVEKALAAVGIDVGAIRQVVEAVDAVEEMIKKIQQMIEDLKALIDKVQEVLDLIGTLESILLRAAEGNAGQIINTALGIVIEEGLEIDEGSRYVYDIECTAMSAWELLDGLEAVTNLGMCGKGLGDLKEVAKVKARIEEARKTLENVLTPDVRSVLHSACEMVSPWDVHPPVRNIHNKTDPKIAGSFTGKLATVKKYMGYGDMACLGAKFLTKPTTDPVKLLEMFGGVNAPGLGSLSDLATAIRLVRDPSGTFDSALASLQAIPAPQILPSYPGASAYGSQFTAHEKQWWETELKGAKNDFTTLAGSGINGIETSLIRLTHGGFVKDLAKPLAAELKSGFGGFKGVGKGAAKDFDAIQNQGKILVDQVQLLAKLFDLPGLEWKDFVQAVAAVGTIGSEFDNLGKTMQRVQGRMSGHHDEFANTRLALRDAIKNLAATIRTLDRELEKELSNSISVFDVAKARALSTRLRAISDRATQAPTKDIPGFPALAQTSQTSADALETLATKMSSASGSLTGLFSPLRPQLNDVATQVERLTEYLEAMEQASSAMGDFASDPSNDFGGASDNMSTLFSKPGEAGIGNLLALMGGVAKQSRKGTELAQTYVTAVENAGGFGNAAPETVAEKVAEEQNIPQRSGESVAPKDKAKGAWEQKMQDANELADKLRGSKPMSPEECRVIKHSIRIAFKACSDLGGTNCVSADTYPCSEQ